MVYGNGDNVVLQQCNFNSSTSKVKFKQKSFTVSNGSCITSKVFA